MDVLKSPCLFEIDSFGESSIFMSPDISYGEGADTLGPSISEDTVSELGVLLSDLSTATPSSKSAGASSSSSQSAPLPKSADEPFRFLGAGDFAAENDVLDFVGLTSSSTSRTSSTARTSPSSSSSSSATTASSSSSSSPSPRAFLNPHQFFARLRRHFESTMFFDHVESLLRRSNRVFFSGETIVRPSVHFYLVLTDEFCRNDNLSSFLRCVGQRIAPEWSDRYNRDHRLTHACHTFYVTASIAAKALSVFEPRASDKAACVDTFRVSELWTDAMEQTRQTIDLLKPEFSMCHSFVGCEGASILSEEMNYSKGVAANNRVRASLDADRRRPQLSSMDMSSLDTDALPPRKRHAHHHGQGDASALDAAGDPVHPRSSSAPPAADQLPPYSRSLSPEPIPRSQSAAPLFHQRGGVGVASHNGGVHTHAQHHHYNSSNNGHHSHHRTAMIDDDDEMSFDDEAHMPPARPAGLHRAASTPFDSLYSRRNSHYHHGGNGGHGHYTPSSVRYSDTRGGYNRESFDESDAPMAAPLTVDVDLPVSRQTPSASMSPGLRRSKRKRTAPGRFADQQQSLTPPPMRTGNGSGFTFGANTPSSSSSSSRSRPMPRRGDREADLARWKRLASDISERLKRRRFSPQTFLN